MDVDDSALGVSESFDDDDDADDDDGDDRPFSRGRRPLVLLVEGSLPAYCCRCAWVLLGECCLPACRCCWWCSTCPLKHMQSGGPVSLLRPQSCT